MPAIAACFFDMDNTLMENDCDVSWKNFLIAEGLAPAGERADSDRNWHAFLDGLITEREFVSFQLRQFTGRSPEEMAPLLERHFRHCVEPRIYPQARSAVRAALNAGLPAVLLTATHHPVARPVADALGMTDALCTEVEIRDGRYTGFPLGPYNILERKTLSATRWLAARGLTLAQARYYGDSEHDLPMLHAAGEAVVVNPRGRLLEIARKNAWRIERWTLGE